MPLNDIIHDTKIVQPVVVDEALVAQFCNLLGSVSVLEGRQLVYDLRQKIYKHAILPLELGTGGPSDEQFPAYKCNWFPGCLTYGFILEQDAPIFNTDDESDPNRQVVGVVYKLDDHHSVSESTVEILTVLDDINTSSKWKSKLNIYYKVRLQSGVIGYIHATLVNKVLYKDC